MKCYTHVPYRDIQLYTTRDCMVKAVAYIMVRILSQLMRNRPEMKLWLVANRPLCTGLW